MNAGSHIGQYRILRKLGAGGMGTVYLAEHILLGRRAAIKTLLPSLSVFPEIVERFFTEARATSAISDAGVVQVYDFGYHVDGTAYIVMELLEGESLSARLERMHSLPQADALKIARQVASALGAAHDKGIVHRDLKPENIYLVRDPEAQGGERAKILDFGICKREGDGSLTEVGTTLGTPVYMAPEQCRGSRAVDQRADIYALGCVLFHMLVGRTPFQCEGAGEYIVAHLQEQPPVATELAPDLHPLIDVLLVRCLAKDPDERYSTMADVQAAIGELMSRISSPGISTATAVPAPVLGTGFKSGNGTSSSPPVPLTPPAAQEWFVDGVDAPPPTSTMAELTDIRGGKGWRRAGFMAVALGAVMAALFATRAAIGDARLDDAPGAIDVAPVIAAPLAATKVAYDTVPPAPEGADVTVERAPDAEAWTHTMTEVALGTAVAMVAVPKVTRPQRAPARATRRQVTNQRADGDDDPSTITPPGTTSREAPKLQPTPTSQSEDLYDTR